MIDPVERLRSGENGPFTIFLRTGSHRRRNGDARGSMFLVICECGHEFSERAQKIRNGKAWCHKCLRMAGGGFMN